MTEPGPQRDANHHPGNLGYHSPRRHMQPGERSQRRKDQGLPRAHVLRLTVTRELTVDRLFPSPLLKAQDCIRSVSPHRYER